MYLNQSGPAFVQSYSQSQARLMFVTTLEMDNFDCTKMNAHFKKFTACLREGLIHEWKQALLAPPLPYVAKQLTALFHTQPFFSFLVYGNVVPTIYCAFWLKPSPALEALGHYHLLGLAYNRKAWAYPMSTVLATVAFLLLLETSLLTLQHSTKLLYFFLFIFLSITAPQVERKL